MSKENISLIRHFVTLIIGAVTAWAVTTTTLKAHIENNYVHKDVSALEETFVRKDVLDVQLTSIDGKLARIMKELDIE